MKERNRLHHGILACLLVALLAPAAPAWAAGGANTDGHPVQLEAPATPASPSLTGTQVSILYAPSEDDDTTLRTNISTITGAAADYWDTSNSTPTLADLQSYGCVFTWANRSYADNVAMGDVLADYVDAGGVVVLGAFVTYTNGNSLSGRIMTPAYAPVVSPTGTNLFTTISYNGDGATLIWDQVTTYSTGYPDDVVLQGSGVADGTLGTDVIGAAYRPDFRVVFLNGAGDGFISTGDTAQLIANACSVGQAAAASAIPALGGSGMLLLIAGLALVAVFLLRWRI